MDHKILIYQKVLKRGNIAYNNIYSNSFAEKLNKSLFKDDGKYTIKVKAVDKAGNESEEKTFYYYYESTPPNNKNARLLESYVIFEYEDNIDPYNGTAYYYVSTKDTSGNYSDITKIACLGKKVSAKEGEEN